MGGPRNRGLSPGHSGGSALLWMCRCRVGDNEDSGRAVEVVNLDP